MSTELAVRPALQPSLGHERRLLVTGQFPDSNLYRSIGFLTCADGGYRFSYLRSAVDSEWFVPLPGLRDVSGTYESSSLFPIFAERIISTRRPDRAETMAALGLQSDAAPFAILERTGGHRVGDSLELISMPTIGSTGRLDQLFLVHGIRHRPSDAQAVIGDLHFRDALDLAPEPGNPVNPKAIRVVNEHEVTLGYVPDPLTELVHEVLTHDRNYELVVEATQGPDVNPKLRLLVRLSGHLPQGTQPFVGGKWTAVAEG